MSYTLVTSCKFTRCGLLVLTLPATYWKITSLEVCKSTHYSLWTQLLLTSKKSLKTLWEIPTFKAEVVLCYNYWLFVAIFTYYTWQKLKTSIVQTVRKFWNFIFSFNPIQQQSSVYWQQASYVKRYVFLDQYHQLGKITSQILTWWLNIELLYVLNYGWCNMWYMFVFN